MDNTEQQAAAILPQIAEVLNSGSAGTAKRYSNQRIDRHKVAEEMGLTTLGTDKGSCAVVLATHKALPNVLVKVTSRHDAFVRWAEYMLELDPSDRPDFFPDVYAVNRIGDFAVVMVERIYGNPPGDIWERKDECEEAGSDFTFSPLSTEWQSWECEETVSEIEDWLEFHGLSDMNCRADLHEQNFLVKEDGTFVCIDPVWNPMQDRAIVEDEGKGDLPAAPSHLRTETTTPRPTPIDELLGLIKDMNA